MRLCCTLLFAMTAVADIPPLFAQSPVAKVEPATNFGSVSGHVYFQDSSAPARLVDVALQPIQVSVPEPYQAGKRPHLNISVYQTGLDGSYLIPRVPQGMYYVVVVAPGMFSPFAQFTTEELARPSPEIAQRMAATLPVVTVQPNSSATLDIRLQRGAGMSGTVRFDDGTPYLNAMISVQRHDSGGKWVSSRADGERTTTDVDGHWQVSGLLPGEYRIRVRLELEDKKKDVLLSDSSSSSSRTRSSQWVFLGDTTRETAAKTVTLEENQQASGEDILVPVSRMHVVTGAVVDAATGKALNAGNVELLYADDGKGASNTTIDPETRTFTFPFASEGEYKLRVENAREVRFEQEAAPSEENPFEEHRKQVTLRQFGNGEAPVVIQSEMSGISIPVQAKAAGTQ
ncbi:MAG: carboxypeptidase regulatory-like domain-containing protein [Janthinobacterium lividum]